MTDGRRRVLDEIGERFALDEVPLETSNPIPAWRLGGRQAPTVIEIGCGSGEHALALADRHPEWNIIGADIHHASLIVFLRRLDTQGFTNVRVFQDDAAWLLDRVAPASVFALQAFFPDPWPKRRHHHRRLVEPTFAARAVRLLEPGGRLELATDIDDYARQMSAVLDRTPGLVGGVIDRPDRVVSHYEQRALDAGRLVVDLRYERTD